MKREGKEQTTKSATVVPPEPPKYPRLCGTHGVVVPDKNDVTTPLFVVARLGNVQ